MTRPSHIDINDVRYPLVDGEGAYSVRWESVIKTRREIAGEQRNVELAEGLRPDFLVWRWDDWSGGMNQKFIDLTRLGTRTFSKYLDSDAAVDVRTPGQVRLGLAMASDLAIGATTVVPRMASTDSSPWVFYDTSAQAKTGGTWTAEPTGLSNNVQGHVAASANRVFVGDGQTELRRVNKSGNIQWVNAEAQSCLVQDNRLFFVADTTERVDLKFVPIGPGNDAPFTATTAGDVDGHESAVGLAGEGENVYVLIGEGGEQVYLYRFNGDTTEGLVEFGKLPSAFRVDNDRRETITVLNGVVFVGGFFTSAFDNVEQPAVLWFTEDRSGMVGRLRHSTADERVTAMMTSTDNQLLFGTDIGNVYAYSMDTGGVYRFASGITAGDKISSMIYNGAQFWFASRSSGGSSTVWASTASGSGKYPSSSKIEGSRWDFALPEEEKLLLSITVSGNFPTNTSADVSIELDDGSEITTDADGTTMSVSTTGDTTFTMSDADTERLFRWAKPNLTLKNTDTSVTPVIYSVTLRATTTAKAKFVEFTVDASDHQQLRVPERNVSGTKAALELETLLDSTTDVVLDIKPYFGGKAPPYPRSTQTYTVLLDEARQVTTSTGQHAIRVRARVI